MIQELLDQDFKQALKSRDEIATSALRNLKAEIHNTEIAKRKPLSDQEVLEVIKKKVKQHKDSIDSFRAGARPDLVEHEERQMAVLSRYLPKQMEEPAVRLIVKQVIADLSATPKDFGKVMKEVMTRSQGATSGDIVSKIVKEELSPTEGAAPPVAGK